jgi:hypothetical protein
MLPPSSELQSKLNEAVTKQGSEMFLRLLLDPENGGEMFFKNAG